MIVVLTRDQGQNRLLAKELNQLGIDVIEFPLIEVNFPAAALEKLASEIAGPEPYTWIVFTSANGVKAYSAASCLVTPSSTKSATRFAAVGDVTAATLTELGFKVDLIPETATASGLVAAFPQANGVETVLAPIAELAGDTLVEGLRRKGYVVKRVDAYRTVDPSDQMPEALRDRLVGADGDAGSASDPPQNRLQNPPSDQPSTIVVFFSPSAVDRFANHLAAISSATAAPVNQIQFQVVVVGPVTAAAAQRRFPGVQVSQPVSYDSAGVLEVVATLAERGRSN